MRSVFAKLSIRTWPERGYAALDAFMCGHAEPVKVVPVLESGFSLARVKSGDVLRGNAGTGNGMLVKTRCGDQSFAWFAG